MYKKIMIALFFGFLFLIPIVSLIAMPKETVAFSENENRYLARFPTLSLNNVLEARYMQEFEDWADDRVAGREYWIKLRNKTDRELGKVEINDVFITDDRMMQAWSGYDETLTDKSLNAMKLFAQRHENVPVYFMLAPTSIELYGDTLPKSAPIASQKDFIKYCYSRLAPEITAIDVLPSLSEQKEHYIYYRTDHHWTSLGAYIAYTEAGKAMGFTPLNMDRFNIETASTSFRGTLHSKTLDDSITPDIINIYTVSHGEPEVKLRVMSGEAAEHDGLYFREFLETKDKYATFLGINAPIIEIYSDISRVTNGSAPGKSLLVFKDSYANCLVPFLAKNYSRITVVDMRYINMSYNQFFNVEDYDSVLFMHNVITFSEDTNIVKLNPGR